MKPTLLILAAGLGSRFGGLKQMAPVGPNGETIMEYSVFDAVRAGFGRIVFVIRRDFEDAFRTQVLPKYKNIKDVEIDLVFQGLTDAMPAGFSVPEGREKPWGTGHAILVARDKVREPFFVITADDFLGYDAFRVASEFLSNPDLGANEYCVVGYKLGKTVTDKGSVNRGIIEVDDKGFVINSKEVKGINIIDGKIQHTDADGTTTVFDYNTPVSMVAFGFTANYLDLLYDAFEKDFLPNNIDNLTAEFFNNAAVDTLIKNGTATLRCIDTTADWVGVTYKEDVPEAVAKIATLGYPDPLFE